MTQNVPEEYANIIDDVCERDKIFFELNPLAISYKRPYCPGEFYPIMPDPENVLHVRVTKIGEGVRARDPLIRPANISTI